MCGSDARLLLAQVLFAVADFNVLDDLQTGSKKQRGGDGASSSSSATSHLRDPLDRQLALLGLRVKNITADGNCFFRSLSDQLQVCVCGWVWGVCGWRVGLGESALHHHPSMRQAGAGVDSRRRGCWVKQKSL